MASSHNFAGSKDSIVAGALNAEQLRKRLPRLALSLAEQINASKYEH